MKTKPLALLTMGDSNGGGVDAEGAVRLVRGTWASPLEKPVDIKPVNDTVPTTGYTKIANDGSKLPDSATLGTNPKDWACTKDNKTGLIWEVKTDDMFGFRSKDWLYTWYQPDASKNGGYAGADIGNTTDTYTKGVNAQGLCGATNWRMPTKNELLGIVKSDVSNSSIDTTYFPNTPSNFVWWSSSPDVNYSSRAWVVNFKIGIGGLGSKSNTGYVRLVQDGTATSTEIKPIVPEQTGTVDLSVAITKPAAVSANKKATYKLTITNNSEFTATGVKAYFVVPGRTLVTVDIPKNCTANGRIVECTVSDLAAKKNATQSFSMTVWKKGALNVGAGVSANEDDTNEDNNEKSAVILVK